MTRPIKARIDLAALRYNYALADTYAKQGAAGAHLWAVIKANGYGHGALRVARGLDQVADGFALIELDTAIALREAGIRQPLLLMEGFYNTDELAAFEQHGLTPVVHRLDQVELLAGRGISLPIYLKLNTGMNRLGLNADEFPVALDRLREYGSSITLMTHFSDADEPLGIACQMDRLNAMLTPSPLVGEGRGEGARRATDPKSTPLPNPLPHGERGRFPLSLANSAAILRFPDSLGDWVRPGIMLYGGSPFPAMRSADDIGLKPVMTLESELIAVRDLQPGDRVGYGGAFVADHPMRIGVVACGYGDGYPRHAPSGTPILVGGQRTTTVGRVSMDKICVDLGGLAEAKVGSPVTLWGDSGFAILSADEVATSAGTVSYELFCALAARVPVVETGIEQR